jgi:hypothetical protein
MVPSPATAVSGNHRVGRTSSDKRQTFLPRALSCWHSRNSARRWRARSVHTRWGYVASPKDSAMLEPSQSTCANDVWFDSGVRHQSVRQEGCLFTSAHCAAIAHTAGLLCGLNRRLSKPQWPYVPPLPDAFMISEARPKTINGGSIF